VSANREQQAGREGPADDDPNRVDRHQCASGYLIVSQVLDQRRHFLPLFVGPTGLAVGLALKSGATDRVRFAPGASAPFGSPALPRTPQEIRQDNDKHKLLNLRDARTHRAIPPLRAVAAAEVGDQQSEGDRPDRDEEDRRVDQEVGGVGDR